jgi:hypothetical protein
MFRAALLAVALLLAGCGDPVPTSHGTAKCYQMGTLIWEGEVHERGLWTFDKDGNELRLPSGCVYQMREGR